MTDLTPERPKSRFAALAATFGSWKGVILAQPTSKRTLGWLVAGSLLRTAIAAPVPFIMKGLFDDVIPDGRTSVIVLFGLAVFLAFTIGILLEAYLRRKAFKFATEGTAVLRQRLHKVIMGTNIDSLRKLGSGGLFDVVGTNVNRVENASVAVVGIALPAAILASVFSVLVLTIEWRLVLIGAALLPFMTLPGFFLGARTRESWRAHHDVYTDYNEFANRSTRLAKLTKASSAEGHEINQHDGLVENVRHLSYTSRVAANDYTAAMRTALALAGTGIMIAGAIFVANGSMTLGRLVSFFAALSLLRPPLQRLIETVPLMSEGKPALDLVERLMALQEEPQPYSTGTKQIELKGFMTAEGISFRYPEGKELFRDLDIEVVPGEITVIVGPNGAGKSTLVSLLLGLRAPTGGRLLADGMPYGELDMHNIRQQMSLLVQELMLDEGPAAEIIAYGRTDLTRDDIVEASKLADAHSFIEKLPDGYDTMIGRNGAELSLGQHQRLSIARALARKPAVLILDEPTNHLDPAAVERILKSLRDLEHAPAIVIVTHHRDVVEWADHVVTIEPPATAKK